MALHQLDAVCLLLDVRLALFPCLLGFRECLLGAIELLFGGGDLLLHVRQRFHFTADFVVVRKKGRAEHARDGGGHGHARTAARRGASEFGSRARSHLRAV